MAQQRLRIKHEKSFEQRLAEEARRFAEAAEKQPAGSMARELLMRRVRQAEAASYMNDLLSPARARARA
jgi:hypothetical protein